MIRPENINGFYFLGIGGIGMSALARYFRRKGKAVAGYDRTRTPLTDRLEAEGIPVHYTDDPGQIPPDFQREEGVMVVYTPAVPKGLKELQFFRDRGMEPVKRAELLGSISDDYPSVAVAGTHGKTSVSTLLSHILSKTGQGCLAFLGGISKNHGSNLVMTGTQPVCVLEADEFDRSFLHLNPGNAIVTSMDADHLDIYGDHSTLKAAFAEFIGKIKPGGRLLIKKSLGEPKAGDLKIYTYSAIDNASFFAENVRREEGRLIFDLVTPGGRIGNLSLGLPGMASLENAVASCSMAWLLGCPQETIRKALKEFKGVRRRFDLQFQKGNIVYIDDYAHHPEELKACIRAVRETYPGRKITGIFQPHLYSRTRDFAGGFAESLDLLDTCILLDIYPAREEPVPGVNADIIRNRMSAPRKVIRCRKEEITGELEKLSPEILLTLGAGDIDTQVESLKEWLEKRYKNEIHGRDLA